MFHGKKRTTCIDLTPAAMLPTTALISQSKAFRKKNKTLDELLVYWWTFKL